MSALQPYEGNEAYIFVSYCHKDKDFTYSLIENLSTNGYRVWYDNGIHPGDNWLETIGGHLNNSKICIAVISEEAAKSHNCLSEINFALEQRITLVPVIISKFEKTPGLRLLINHTQYINAYDFRLDQQTDTNAFYQKLLLSSDFQACREAKLGNQPIKLLPMQRKKKPQQNSGAVNQIVIIEETKRRDKAILIDLETGIVCPISEHTSVGRETYNDLCIPDKTISASHAELDLQKDGTVKVTDLESTNGTYLNGERLDPMVQTTVGNFSFITMADRHMLLLKGETAAEVMDCGFCARTGCWPSNARDRARLSAEVTHNHPEGIKGAMAVADAIFMNRFNFGGYCSDYGTPINDKPDECKRKVKEHIEREYGYDLSRTLNEIRPSYTFNETCQETVPQAIIAFLESTDFEDAVRNAVSLGGDSDTLAAMAGSIAEAAYGIPDWIGEKAYSCLDEPLKDVLRRWRKFISQS